jgi:hypothetical protein
MPCRDERDALASIFEPKGRLPPRAGQESEGAMPESLTGLAHGNPVAAVAANQVAGRQL